MLIRQFLYKNLYISFLAFLFSCFALSAQNEGLNDFPVLRDLYEVNKSPVDFILVVDQSGSVRRFWEPIKESASRLVELANNGDHFTLVGFKDDADNLVLARAVNQENKQSLIDEIRRLPNPTGSYTDLFESVDFLLEKGINRPESNRLQLVFYFTDFINSPPPGSPWSVSNIEVIKNKRINYIDQTGKLVNVFAFQLPLDAGAGRDFDRFSAIFDNKVKRIISDLRTMQEWFDRLSMEISREKLKLLLQDDLKSFLHVERAGMSGNNIEILVKNKLDIPFFLDRVDLISQESGLTVSGELSGIEIPAQGSRMIPISISSYLQKEQSFLEKSIIVQNPVITLNGNFPTVSTELGVLNIPDKQTVSIPLDQSLKVKVGLRFWQAAIILLALALLLYFIYITWIKSEWLFGKKAFRLTISMDGKLLGNSTKTYQITRKPLIINQSFINHNDVPVEKEKMVSTLNFNVYLDPVKPRFPSFSPRRGTYISAESSTGRFKINKMEKGKMTVSAVPSGRTLHAEKLSIYKGVNFSGEFASGLTKAKLEFKILPIA